MPSLKEVRKDCECWDEEFACLDDYPKECPLYEACKKEAEGTDEELVPA